MNSEGIRFCIAAGILAIFWFGVLCAKVDDVVKNVFIGFAIAILAAVGHFVLICYMLKQIAKAFIS